MKIGNLSIPGMAALAPMAGVTDWAYRTICTELGASLTVTEMVSSRALVYRDKKSAALLRPVSGAINGVQIFGNDPSVMAEAAGLALELSGCDFIDINMGCPMRKIACNGDGCGLMRTPELALRIVEAVCGAVPVPVTVKTRKGWDKGSVNVVELARGLESAGCAAITVHGRTRAMLYSGVADWDIIRKVKEAVSVPVIANGDVVSWDSARMCLARSGADHVMIGRAAFGDPWIFREINAGAAGQPLPERPPLTERMDTAMRQFFLTAEDKGEHIACLEARKQLAWYLRGVAYSGYYKEQISHIASAEDVRRIVDGVCRDLR